MKKTLKKAIALLLCVVLMASTFGVASFAEEKETVKYVAVGDSASMGYLMDDYSDHVQHNVNNLTGATIDPSSSFSVFYRFNEYLKEQGYNVEATDLSMTGMRSLEFRSLIDHSYYDAHKTEIFDDTSATTFWGYHMADYLFNNWKHGYAYSEGVPYIDNDTYESVEPYLDAAYENIYKTYTEKIADADILTYDLTMNDFGTYFGSRFIDIDGAPYVNDTFAKLMEEDGSPEIAQSAELLRSSIESLLKDKGVDMDKINKYVDAVLYSFAGLCINFSKSMDIIYGMNEDIQIIVNGPYNVMEGIKFDLNGTELNAEEIWGLLNEAVTAYICKVDKHSNQYKLADLSGGCETFAQLLATGTVVPGEYPNEWMVNQFKNWFGFGDILNGIKTGVTAGYVAGAIAQGCPEQQAEAYVAANCAQEIQGIVDGYEDMMFANLCKGAAFMTIPLTEVLAVMKDAQPAVVKALMNFDNEIDVTNPDFSDQSTQILMAVYSAAGVKDDPETDVNEMVTTDADRGFLSVALHFAHAYALGAHPDAKGYDQKMAAVIKAYESDYTADGTYVARVMEKTLSFKEAFMNLLRGEPGAAQVLKDMILDLFAPITKIFNLLGSFVNK